MDGERREARLRSWWPMNLHFSPDEDAFRDQVRTWLRENVPKEPPPMPGIESRAYDVEWQRRQFDAGWGGISWPREYGGCGFSLTQQLIWHEEYARADGPFMGVNFVGLSHAGPTLILRGSEEQKRFHLPKILRADEIWCQGFSEPGAGSDLASLRTRADIDGDHLVVNGQKIWTSYADTAQSQELLVRTDAAAVKHKGISWVICDMASPGITVRPIKSISGGAHFCEVFYDDVRIPISNVVGGLNNGWSIAMSTLAFERGTAFMAEQVMLARRIERLIGLAGDIKAPDGRRPAILDDEFARRLATVRAECAALRAMTLASVSRNARQELPGPEGSMVRLYFALLVQRVGALAMDMLGAPALAYDPQPHAWSHQYFYEFAQTIGGGTSEIQRNIIGERVLGLPKSA
jgi:alkylation response protein AidB-like acyl-CoA dehydrogenase